MDIDAIARVCHEANRAYCVSTGDPGLPEWDALDESYRESSRHGVRQVLEGTTPAQSHESWARERQAAGWKYGTTLDREKKVHPNLMPYERLPIAQQLKDRLFIAIVTVLSGYQR